MCLRSDIENTINRHCDEICNNMMDFLLADSLMDGLRNFDRAARTRETWYGRDTESRGQPGEASEAVIFVGVGIASNQITFLRDASFDDQIVERDALSKVTFALACEQGRNFDFKSFTGAMNS